MKKSVKNFGKVFTKFLKIIIVTFYRTLGNFRKTKMFPEILDKFKKFEKKSQKLFEILENYKIFPEMLVKFKKFGKKSQKLLKIPKKKFWCFIFIKVLQ